MSKPLIDRTSMLYLRRLARELRGQEHGFYYEGFRYWSASTGMVDGKPVLRLQRHGGDGYGLRVLELPAWVAAYAGEKEKFCDAYGRAIYASRVAPR